MKKKKNDSVKDVLCQVFEFTEADIRLLAVNKSSTRHLTLAKISIIL